MSIRQAALYRDGSGTDWPVPTANIATLGRQLKSSKGKMQYYLLPQKSHSLMMKI